MPLSLHDPLQKYFLTIGLKRTETSLCLDTIHTLIRIKSCRVPNRKAICSLLEHGSKTVSAG